MHVCFLLGGVLWLSAFGQAQSTEKQHVEVSLRMIGHQVLLQAGDSTSPVLPIEKVGPRYKIQFAAEFGFVPDELVEVVSKVMHETQMAGGYILEVENCESREVVYSYEIADVAIKSIIPCKERALPKACYNLLFTLLETGENEVNPPTVKQETAGGTYAEKSKTSYTSILVFIALLGGGLVFFWKKKGQAKSDPSLIAIGTYQFDTRNTMLIGEHESIELTGKEADLLLLLYSAANTTVEREVILSKVWGDEGDYIGRTLDVFISKLRKKLEEDSNVKIVNIRGVGYKLVLDV